MSFLRMTFCVAHPALRHIDDRHVRYAAVADPRCFVGCRPPLPRARGLFRATQTPSHDAVELLQPRVADTMEDVVALPSLWRESNVPRTFRIAGGVEACTHYLSIICELGVPSLAPSASELAPSPCLLVPSYSA